MHSLPFSLPPFPASVTPPASQCSSLVPNLNTHFRHNVTHLNVSKWHARCTVGMVNFVELISMFGEDVYFPHCLCCIFMLTMSHTADRLKCTLSASCDLGNTRFTKA